MPRQRRCFSPQAKIGILRLHHLEGRPISAVCEEHEITPTLFYQWQKTFFEKGAAAFESGRSDRRAEQKTIAALDERLRRKDEVVAEIAA